MTYALSAGPSGWAWLAMAVSVLVLGALSGGAYLLLVRGGGRPAEHASAERRLAEQFARGQITEQEYLHLTAALDAANSGPRRGIHLPARRRPHRRVTDPGERRSSRRERTRRWRCVTDHPPRPTASPRQAPDAVTGPKAQLDPTDGVVRRGMRPEGHARDAETADDRDETHGQIDAGAPLLGPVNVLQIQQQGRLVDDQGVATP